MVMVQGKLRISRSAEQSATKCDSKKTVGINCPPFFLAGCLPSEGSEAEEGGG